MTRRSSSARPQSGIKHKHNLRFGADYRRLWTTLRSNADPRGIVHLYGL